MAGLWIWFGRLNKCKHVRKMEQQSEPKAVDASADRVFAFSDGVFAIIITIMVLELKKPAGDDFHAVLSLWPTWLSYATSYLFISIVWLNHHYLLRNLSGVSLRLLWANFGHLFSVSLIPFLTDWVAESKLAPVPVSLYAFVFLTVNVSYLILVWESQQDGRTKEHKPLASWMIRLRSTATIAVFLVSTVISLWAPILGFTMVCGCLILYTRPEIKASNQHLVRLGKIQKFLRYPTDKR
ncbi:Uncharacterized membrane protein [Dyadobacter sp. SG02]|nr:Uncharacterized membrane protein [Dyadobacter sp. SG02]